MKWNHASLQIWNQGIVTSSPCVERQYSFAAILSAILMTLSLLGAVISIAVQDWFVMAASGIVMLAGIGFAILALRDDA